jgi:3,4-dihydroxy 2-butanone 4-phosphate synthase/GTP cyclohydrolase II
MVMMDEIKSRLHEAYKHRELTGKPFVTVSYAQSLDGSIAARPGRPMVLSSPESLVLTHSLRACHDAILVGIGCVLADDPRLNVRLAPGSNPRPIVLDSRLRLPPYAQLLTNGSPSPWIFTSETANDERGKYLQKLGARIFRIPSTPDAKIDIVTMLSKLGDLGITTLMVEGGAQVITSFLIARLVNQVVITISPILVGGTRAVDALTRFNPNHFPKLTNVSYEKMGDDIIIRADTQWDSHE